MPRSRRRIPRSGPTCTCISAGWRSGEGFPAWGPSPWRGHPAAEGHRARKRPGRARVLFQMASAERSVIGCIGPLTGEEGHSVSAVFDPKSPPVLYLGQKTIPEKPFLYSFGLPPKQEG